MNPRRHTLDLPPVPRRTPRGWRAAGQGLVMLGAAYVGLMALHRLAPDGPAAQLVLVGMVLVIGALAGRIAAALGIPRLTGYLLAGVLMSPSLADALHVEPLLVTHEQAKGLGLLNNLAVGIIGLMAGAEIRAGWLRQRLAGIGRIVVAETLLVPVALVAVVLAPGWLGFPGFPFVAQAVAQGLPAWLAAAVVAGVLLANSPMVVVSVIKETGANGPLAQTLMGTSVVLDAVVVLLVTILLALADVLLAGVSTGGALVGAFASVAAGILASLVLGSLAGWGLRHYTGHSDHRLEWVVVGLALAVSVLGPLVGLKPLFTLLAAGFVFNNQPAWLPGASDLDAADLAHHRLQGALAQVGAPVFVIFFCAAGVSVAVPTLLAVWPLVLALGVVRAGAIWLAVRRGATALEAPVRRYAWIGLISQAGVTLALAQLVAGRFPGWGSGLATCVIALVTVHELIAPPALVWALRKVGEVK